MVAVGGGVVGDLAGFCAAVYQRGMRHVQVPTTLVAQVDSAYGGKTGVDLPEGKNYAGSYHQPSAVLADPAALATLPAAELAAGYAEVVKTALIAGGGLWARVRQGGDPDLETVIALRPDEARGGGRDERDAGQGRCSTLVTRWPRDRGRDRLRALPARRGGGHRVAGGAPPLRAGTRCAPRWPSCWVLAGCRRGSAEPGWTRWWRSWRATRSASAAGCRSCCVRPPARSPRAPRGARADLRAAVEEVHEGCADRVEVIHGVNLDVLGRRDAAHYGGLTLTELEVRVRQFGRELGLEVASSRRTTRASSRVAPPAPARQATGWS